MDVEDVRNLPPKHFITHGFKSVDGAIKICQIIFAQTLCFILAVFQNRIFIHARIREVIMFYRERRNLVAMLVQELFILHLDFSVIARLVVGKTVVARHLLALLQQPASEGITAQHGFLILCQAAAMKTQMTKIMIAQFHARIQP